MSRRHCKRGKGSLLRLLSNIVPAFVNAVGGRPGLRFLLPSYLAAMRWRYQRRSVAGVATDAISASAAAQSLGLDREPAPVVVRELETLAPKPGSEHTVLLSQVVNHILLLAVDPASQNEQ